MHQFYGADVLLSGVFVTTPPVGISDEASIIDVLQFIGLKLMMHTTDKTQNTVGEN